MDDLDKQFKSVVANMDTNGEEVQDMQKMLSSEFKNFKKKAVKESVSSMAAAYRLRKQQKAKKEESDGEDS